MNDMQVIYFGVGIIIGQIIGTIIVMIIIKKLQ